MASKPPAPEGDDDDPEKWDLATLLEKALPLVSLVAEQESDPAKVVEILVLILVIHWINQHGRGDDNG